jgi:uncharacterized tellurite resistance protein B-like protein
MPNDELNCIKNLLQIMCCDGRIEPQEKEFLAAAAKAMKVEVADWNALLREVAKDGQETYPVVHREKAAATLKAMALMAKTDGEVEEKEKKLLQAFARCIGLSKEQWKQMLSELDMATVFEPFQKSLGRLAVLEEDFEKIDAFLKTAGENNAQTRVLSFAEYLNQPVQAGEMVCFHASENKEKTLQKCSALLQKAGQGTVCVLTRFQGLQVKYLHEAGLTKCIIEPVYAKDIVDLFR